MLWLGGSAPQRYRMLLQEDRIVEWGTVWLFLAAGFMTLRRSIRHRRGFDGLVALFCLFVAGEEFSWGQRLLGYAPPEFFLRNNLQQELTIHNLPHLQPGSILMAALAGYGVLLPVLSRTAASQKLIRGAVTTAPPLALLPWYAVATMLLWWYPLTLTGEWVELLAGALFLMATRPTSSTLWTMLAMTVAFGATMTPVAGVLGRGRDHARIACATVETINLAADVAAGDAGTSALSLKRRVHKRIWSSINDHYIDGVRLRRFEATTCGASEEATAQIRRRYGVDPWGSPYWLLIESHGNEQHVTVYSFGPNRRRDPPASHASDDVVAMRIRRTGGVD